jgi:hypothetical protein
MLGIFILRSAGSLPAVRQGFLFWAQNPQRMLGIFILRGTSYILTDFCLGQR